MSNVLSSNNIAERIFNFRNIQVIVDRDLADLYQVETKVLNQAVKRNLDRFPETFRFQLFDHEKAELVTICDRFKNLKHSSINPYVFSEPGVAMVSSILRNRMAVQVSIQIVQTFVRMRQFVSNHADIFYRLDRLDQKTKEADKKFEEIFTSLEYKNPKPEKGIFFDGQVYDAYIFIAGLIRSANSSISLIDNYVDDTVLTVLSKAQKNAKVTIYTKSISKQLKLDLEKHNSQYPPIHIKILDKAHDRFILIDNAELYHIGASLKDLGKKWFAFSKMNIEINTIIKKLIVNDSK